MPPHHEDSAQFVVVVAVAVALGYFSNNDNCNNNNVTRCPELSKKSKIGAQKWKSVICDALGLANRHVR